MGHAVNINKKSSCRLKSSGITNWCV